MAARLAELRAFPSSVRGPVDLVVGVVLPGIVVVLSIQTLSRPGTWVGRMISVLIWFTPVQT